ncbi:MAG: RNA polymerase subunit sigma-24 [Actinobacteria bacterium HGW-Actinobacteria-4]|nr:MAG: RNA polymerase subunit sigma-24 [Actinobacteria bacterium HGW-Actinobacteria-4]
MAATWPHLMETLVRERGRRLFGYAYMLTGSTQDADDLVQSALIKVFSRSRNLTSIEAAESYTYKTIRTLFLDDRRLARHTRENTNVSADAALPDASAAIDTRLAIQRALLSLPPRERLCVVLRFYDDMSMVQIAHDLGLAPGTVRKYVHSGLARLGEAAAHLGLSAEDIADDDHISVTVVTRKEA